MAPRGAGSRLAPIGNHFAEHGAFFFVDCAPLGCGFDCLFDEVRRDSVERVVEGPLDRGESDGVEENDFVVARARIPSRSCMAVPPFTMNRAPPSSW